MARRAIAVLLVLGMAGGGVALRSPPASAARGRVLVVDGKGWGHGRGMGQWGAYGMARKGATWTRILDRYYPDASLRRRPKGEQVRVLVASRRSVRLQSRERMTVSWRDGRRIARAARVRVRRPGDRTIVEVGSGRRSWTRVATGTKAVRVRPRGALLWLIEPSGTARGYRGAIDVVRRREVLAAVNVVRMDDYLRGVLPREMPASWPLHALRAQAVAARTYTVRVKRAARAVGARWDLCDSAACQVYGGAARRVRMSRRAILLEHPRATRAVRDTTRRVLVVRGRPILAQYSSSTGGYSAPGGVPGLRAVRDPADRVSPYHSWRVSIPAALIEERWPGIGRLERVHVVRRNGYGTWGGRANRVRLQGSRSSVVVSGDRFRLAFGLRSDWFRFRWTRAPYRFTFDMGYGTSHPAVRALQDRLLREGFYSSDAPRTSYYGRITRASVRRYQRAHGIRTTGYLGPITRRSLNRG